MVEMRALIAQDRYFDPIAENYATFSHDRTASNEYILIEPARIHRIPVTSIDGVLDALINFGQRGDKDFVIATHGNPNGLPLRIRAGSPVTMNHDIMDDFSAALDGNARAREGLANMVAQGGGRVFQNAQQLDQLMGKLRQVRDLRFGQLEFRGCNIGAGPALKAIHRLFGAHITDGPTVQFMWSSLATATLRNLSDQRFRAEMQRLGPQRREFTLSQIYRAGVGADPDQVAVGIGINQNAIRFVARSWDMVRGFSESYLQNPILFALDQPPPGGGYRPGRRLPIIAFLTPNGNLPFVIPGDSFDYTARIAREIVPTSLFP